MLFVASDPPHACRMAVACDACLLLPQAPTRPCAPTSAAPTPHRPRASRSSRRSCASARGDPVHCTAHVVALHSAVMPPRPYMSAAVTAGDSLRSRSEERVPVQAARHRAPLNRLACGRTAAACARARSHRRILVRRPHANSGTLRRVAVRSAAVRRRLRSLVRKTFAGQ